MTPMSSLTVESTHNPRVKAAARLRDRAERDETGLTIVDGPREVTRAVRSGVAIEEAFVCEALVGDVESAEAIDAARGAALTVIDASPPVMARLGFGGRTEAVVAVVRTPPSELASIILPANPLVVVMDGLEKPGNVGAILRTADGAGADAVVATDPSTDLYNPNAIRASLGTIFRLRPAAASVSDTIAWLKQNRLRIVVARVDGERLYTDVDLTGPLAIVVGSEAAGLSPTWDSAALTAVRIPMLGLADSLNVSVAAAVLLYEARRQRG